ncbi:hypothetical protein F5884DRAFT_115827 [Xylogone sp. PMI_703]|nr:hypothetical protein F5884DRAFT_115827 [Xylogone sp. PMI_703]
MVKIFALGVTGYIGGDALYAIAQAHPDYEITALVRNSDKAALVTKEYPGIRIVQGDLDNDTIITEEAAKADIVCHFADADHPGAAKAIVQGLLKAPTIGYYIHTSGTGILVIDDIESNSYGAPSEKIYDDYDGVSEVTSLRDSAWHREVDKIVLHAGTEHFSHIKTAIVCPPTIYGPGRGPGNQRSHQAYELSRATLTRGRGFTVNAGLAKWCEVHVHDLSDLYVRLVEEAVKGGGRATWGSDGYYFAENGEFVWGDIAKEVAEVAYKKGMIKTPEIDQVSVEEANTFSPSGAALWGTNSRSRAIRGRKLLGWNPTGKSLREELPGIVELEAKRLKLI